jgi:hypothetical protein
MPVVGVQQPHVPIEQYYKEVMKYGTPTPYAKAITSQPLAFVAFELCASIMLAKA